METLDLFFIVFLVIGTIIGLIKGFLNQLASILGLIVGLIAAKALYISLADKLLPFIGEGSQSMTIAQIIAFVVIWFAIPLLFTFISSMLTRALNKVSLGWVNRLLGGILGFLKYFILLALLIVLNEYLDTNHVFLSKERKENSIIYYPTNNVVKSFFPLAKEMYNDLMK